MKIQLIGKTEGVFKVDVNTDSPDIFQLYTESGRCIEASMYYIDEIIELLLKAKEISGLGRSGNIYDCP